MNESNNELLDYFNGDNLASDVWKSKYATEGEKTPDQMHRRMAKEFAKVEAKYQNEEMSLEHLSAYGKSRPNLTEERIYNLFKDFKYIVPQGSVMATLGTDVIASLSNCWVTSSPLDSYASINKTDGDLIFYYKRRGGVGVDISKLRPKNTLTNNAAKTTTGAVSFMERFSNTTREVAMNGRRGALMISISINHPDVLDFIKIKSDKTKVTGANISVQLTDKFMEAVKKEEDYILKFPVDADLKDYSFDNSVPYNELLEAEFDGVKVSYKKIKAKEYWDELIKQAKENAEPGLMYWDRVQDYDPASVYPEYKAITSNPCFRGDMRLLTAEGYKTFEELENQEVELVNKNGEIVNGTVWCSGEKKIYRVLLWNNTSIFCTKDHKFMTTEELEVEAINLEGKRLMPLYSINKQIDEFVKLGFIQGDGQLTDLLKQSNKGITINIGKDDGDVAEIFNYTGSGRKYYTADYTKDILQNEFVLVTSDKRVLPKKFNEWSLQDKKSFFKGLYSANGCVVKKHRVSFKTTSKKLIEDMALFLDKLGINSYVTTNKEKEAQFDNGNYICKESYDLNISKLDSILIFAKEIGFIHEYKNKDLKELILEKAPKVRSVTYSSFDKVYDFNLQDDTHWGVVEGVIAHNCGEQFLNANDSCRLMAYNLFSFVDKPFTSEAEFNLEKWYEYVYEGTRLGDNLVDLEAEYIERIIQKIKSDPEPEEIKERELKLWEDSKAKSLAGRRMGMGITAMGDTLAALGLKYDSEEALKAMEEILSVKLKAELDCSIDLSITRGSFEGWSTDIEFPSAIAGNSFYNFIEKTFPEQTNRMQKYGRRNVNISTIAPTGSVSLLTHTTSGIEPLFKAFHIRRKKVNPGEVGVRVDFVDDVGDSWTEFPVLHPKFKDWLMIKGYQDVTSYDKVALQALFEESPWYKSEAEDIDWVNRVAIQSLVQKYITNAISSTINLPSTVTHEQVSEIYMKGWEMELKGQTVYVDGSRSGVLVTETTKTNANREDFEYVDAVKRPKELECFAHRSTSKGVEYSVIVGLLNNRPYEIFITEGKAYGSGVIRKEKQGEYIFVKTGVSEYKQFEEQITANMTEEQEAITRLASGMLRHGADVKFVVEQFRKTSGSMFDFTASLARVLKKYIKEGVESTLSCESCGEKSVIFEEGCSKCLACGHSACN